MEQLLYSRKQTAEILGFKSVDPVIALEEKGLLHRVPNCGEVRYHIDEIRAFAEGGLREPNDFTIFNFRKQQRLLEQKTKRIEELEDKLNNIKVAGGF